MGLPAKFLGPVLAFLAAGCATTQVSPPTSELAELRRTIDALYEAFCFEPGAEPDWEAQRAIYLDGAIFVPPSRPDRAPRAQSTDEFLADFRAFVTAEPYRSTGFHERIVGVTADVFGGIAHAFVAFEGFVPGDGAAATLGLDSLQFVRDGDAWKLVSFTTQYASDGRELPTRFLDDGAGAAATP